ncbi:MAG: hypothetical protein EPO32_06495 [Anaerolineae bacterium]|nr:MAG: hypothetical protein EPO32_06495 [Anaerolineae bacterium]
MPKPILIDAHEDLSWNMLTFGRDYTRSVAETRHAEADGIARLVNGETLLGRDAYQTGRVAMVIATLFAAPLRHKLGDWDVLCYADENEARTLYRRQLDAYHDLFDRRPEHFVPLHTRGELAAHLRRWENAAEGEEHPVGLILSIEGAEGIRTPAELEGWWEGGVRLIGPAWGGNKYTGGTKEPGPLTNEGRALLEGMAALGFVLDISHMDEPAALEALDRYEGKVIASHANAKALLPGTQSNRFLTDETIAALVARSGVMGAVPYNAFLQHGWKAGDGRESIPLDALAAHIDHTCQIAGNARHAGIGSDADGGFGLQAVPTGMDTLADLRQLDGLLTARGYTKDDIELIFSGNWRRLLEACLPESA